MPGTIESTAARQDTEMDKIEKAVNGAPLITLANLITKYRSACESGTRRDRLVCRQAIMDLIRPIIAERDKLKAECERMREAIEAVVKEYPKYTVCLSDGWHRLADLAAEPNS